MDYKKLRIEELQKLLKKRKIEFRSMARKKELINLLESHDEEIVEKQTKVEKLISKKKTTTKKTTANKEAKVKTFKKSEIKKLDGVIKDLIKLARQSNNLIDDTTISLQLSKAFDQNYPKEMFIKIEKQLELKNIAINYTNDKLISSLMELRNVELAAGEEEIDYNIESILKGGSKNQNYDEIKNFLSTINDYPLLSIEKEHEVTRTIDKYRRKMESGKKLTIKEQEAYEDARELLILSNKRLVVSIAKKHLNRGMDLIDLVMEGMLGLEKAIQKFDVDAGFKFSTYATWWIRQGITRGLADKSKVIRVPVHMVETINKVAKAQRELLQQNGQEPTLEEIGQAVSPQMTAEQVEHIFDISRDPIPLEMPVGEDNSALEAFIEDNKNVDQAHEAEDKELHQILIGLIYELPPQEGDVLLYRYGLYNFNFESFQLLIRMAVYVRDGLKENRINSKDVETIVQLTNTLTQAQKDIILKRLKNNNAHYDQIVTNLESYENQEEQNVEIKQAVEKAKQHLEEIKSQNLQHLDQVILNTEERIERLEDVYDMTEGIVKPLTLEQVGLVFDVTRERIRQIENRGKRKLKSVVQQKELDLFLK